MASFSSHQEVARRYAQALFDMALEKKALVQMTADLAALRQIVTAAAFQSAMINVTLKREALKKAVMAIADHANVSDLMKNFLGVLAIKRRLAALPAIIDCLEEKVARHNGEIAAHVTVARPLDKGQIDSIAANLKKTLGLSVKVNVTEDPAIMGGLIVRVGSRLFDNSIRSKLERLTRALKTQSSSTSNTKIREVA